jgi:regulatory protein
MSLITKISEQKRRPNRRMIFLDGKFVFGCNVNVVARFRLREGMSLDSKQIDAIKNGEVKQGCFDSAMRFLSLRLHSEAELSRKLKRQEWGDEIIERVLKDLARLGYVDDKRFAKTKALSAAKHKHHGRRRAVVELLKAGVERETARRAVEDVYDPHDSLAVARNLAQKKAAHLRRLDPLVARRRLTGMLARRGFEYEVVRPVIDEVLGSFDEVL